MAGIVLAGIGVVAAVAAAIVGVGARLSVRGWAGPASDHFDGVRFRNADAAPTPEPGKVLRWLVTRKDGLWRREPAPRPRSLPPARVGRGEMRVTFVGHATVLVQMDGLNLLTDPVWSERAGPNRWAGPRRFRPPALPLEELPPIDVVLLSHNHYDHLDPAALRWLVAHHRARVLAPLGNAAALAAMGVDAAEDLDWWQGAALGRGLTATLVPARHFSGRGLFDRDRALWGGFVVSGPSGAMYFAGDTGDGPHFADIAARFPDIRLALLPIGAYRPRWLMAPVHVDPEEAVRAAVTLGAATSVAIHWGTFKLSEEGQETPVHDLERALAALGEAAPRFWVLGPGEGRAVPTREAAALALAEGRRIG